MGIRFNYVSCQRKFACVIFFATALITCACAADDAQKQQSATGAASGPESVAEENAAVVAKATEVTNRESTSEIAVPYSVDCGQVDDAGEPYCYVDADTYIGWRTYHGFCHVCHAQDAVGSTFAPNLLDRMRQSDMTRDLFAQRLSDGFTGQMGVMPPWKDNPNVSKRYNELYAYLTARASGALPPGRPKKKPQSD